MLALYFEKGLMKPTSDERRDGAVRVVNAKLHTYIQPSASRIDDDCDVKRAELDRTIRILTERRQKRGLASWTRDLMKSYLLKCE